MSDPQVHDPHSPQNHHSPHAHHRHSPHDQHSARDHHSHGQDARQPGGAADGDHKHDRHAHGHGARQHGSAADDDYTDLLDLDAEVLHDYWSAALDWVRDEAADAPRTRLLDLGAGTGVGAIGLARRYPDAEVVALDVSPAGLARVRAKLADLDLAQRVRTVEADLDLGWPDLGWSARSVSPTPFALSASSTTDASPTPSTPHASPTPSTLDVSSGSPAPPTPTLDLTWASMSLHHMADPGRVLRDALAATRPGGLIAVAEFAEALRFLPDDLGFGRPGFESRIGDVLGRAHAEEMPTLGSAWAPHLTEAGWHVVAERDFPINLDLPAHPDAARYARAWFARLSEGLADRLEPGDRATLAELLDEDSPRSVLHRANLHIRGTRTITVARRD